MIYLQATLILKGTVTIYLIVYRNISYITDIDISRDQVEQDETNELITRIFRGSPTQFMTAFLKRDNLSMEHLETLKKLIEEKENEKH